MKIDIVRAWKDAEYRNSLTPEELASLPANPTGPTPASDEELAAVTGGLRRLLRSSSSTVYPDIGCCDNSTIGPKTTVYPDIGCCDNSTIGPKLSMY
jgi:mersacidin/lichenicidin family type 2 lantibiotic